MTDLSNLPTPASMPRMGGLNRAQRRALDKAARRSGSMVAALDRPSDEDVRRAARDLMAQRAEEALRILEAKVEGVVLRILDDLIQAAVGRLNDDDSPSLLAAADVLSLDSLAAIPTAWRAALPEALEGLGQAYGAGAYATALRFDAPVPGAAVQDVLDQRAVNHLADAGNRMVGIGDNAWHGIRSTLETEFSKGAGIEDMAKAVRKSSSLALDRARTVARTETIRAVNAGQFDTATALKINAKKQWLSTIDARTRPTHATADGQTVALDSEFTVGASTLSYPGDPVGPAAETVNCRCTLLFVDDADDTDTTNRQFLGDTTEALAASGQEATMAGKHRMSIGNGAVTVTLDGDADPAAVGAAVAVALRNSLAARGVTLATDVLETEVIETAPEARPDTPPKTDEDAGDPHPETWHSVLVVEGKPTGDRRLIEEGALTWRDLPLPIEYQTVQPEMGGHANAVHVAQVTRVERSGAEIHAWGYHLTERAEGQTEPTEGERWMATLRETGRLGVSVDMDDADIEVDWPEVDDDADPMEAMFAEPELVRFTRARLMGATCVPFPAFSEAFIEPLDPAEAEEPVEPDDTDEMLASAAMSAPPSAHFVNPRFARLTPHTVTDDGRVMGHLAGKSTCHTGFANSCVTLPIEDEPAFFTTGEIVTAEGDRFAVGQITMGTGHARPGLPSAETVAHYDHTGRAVADVVAGFDDHGLWYSGSLRPGVTPEEVRNFRASALSGDWRRIGGALRLVAALAVNVPGLPIPRTQASVREGVQMSLAAAGIVPPEHEHRPTHGRHPVPDALVERIAASVGRGRQARIDALTARVHGPSVTEMASKPCLPCQKNAARARSVQPVSVRRDDLRASASIVPTYEVVHSGGIEKGITTLMEARRIRKDKNGTIRVR